MESRPWHGAYPAGMPRSLVPYPRITLLDVLSRVVREKPHHTAMIFEQTAFSYETLERLSDAFASALQSLGVRRGDRVALLLPNCPQLLVAQFGAWKVGAIVGPINPLYTERELEYVLNESGAETLVVLKAFYEKALKIVPGTSLRRVIVTGIADLLPPSRRLLERALRREGRRVSLREGDLPFSSLLRRYQRKAPPRVAIRVEDPAILLFSGGTTGLPKVATGTHLAYIMTGMQTVMWHRSLVSDWGDPTLVALPLFHVYGNLGVISAAMIRHNPMVLVPNARDTNALLKNILRHRPTVFPTVPSLMHNLVEHPDVKSGKVDLSCLRITFSGAASLPHDLKVRFEGHTRGRVIEGYGLTESMMAAVSTPPNAPHRVGSVGVPLPDVDLRIGETGALGLRPLVPGEVLMKAPQIMAGYWARPKETAETLHDGWLRTGDIGYLDGEGYLFLVDRSKDVINTGGFQVWPGEVEDIIASHPAVAEVGVAGVPDDKQGERVVAWVVLRPGRRATEEEIRVTCHQALAGYKVPRQVIFCDTLERNATGKVLRRSLSLPQEPSSDENGPLIRA